MLLGPGLPVQTQALLMWRCSQPRRCWRALPQAQPAAGSAAALLPPAAGERLRGHRRCWLECWRWCGRGWLQLGWPQLIGVRSRRRRRCSHCVHHMGGMTNSSQCLGQAQHARQCMQSCSSAIHHGAQQAEKVPVQAAHLSDGHLRAAQAPRTAPAAALCAQSACHALQPHPRARGSCQAECWLGY